MENFRPRHKNSKITLWARRRQRISSSPDSALFHALGWNLMPCIVKPYNMLSNIRNFVAVDVFSLEPFRRKCLSTFHSANFRLIPHFLRWEKKLGSGGMARQWRCAHSQSPDEQLSSSVKIWMSWLDYRAIQDGLCWVGGKKFKARLEKAFLPLNKRLRFSPSLCGKLFVDVCLFCCSCRRSPWELLELFIFCSFAVNSIELFLLRLHVSEAAEKKVFELKTSLCYLRFLRNFSFSERDSICERQAVYISFGGKFAPSPTWLRNDAVKGEEINVQH